MALELGASLVRTLRSSVELELLARPPASHSLGASLRPFRGCSVGRAAVVAMRGVVALRDVLVLRSDTALRAEALADGSGSS